MLGLKLSGIFVSGAVLAGEYTFDGRFFFDRDPEVATRCEAVFFGFISNDVRDFLAFFADSVVDGESVLEDDFLN